MGQHHHLILIIIIVVIIIIIIIGKTYRFSYLHSLTIVQYAERICDFCRVVCLFSAAFRIFMQESRTSMPRKSHNPARYCRIYYNRIYSTQRVFVLRTCLVSKNNRCFLSAYRSQQLCSTLIRKLCSFTLALVTCILGFHL